MHCKSPTRPGARPGPRPRTRRRARPPRPRRRGAGRAASAPAPPRRRPATSPGLRPQAGEATSRLGQTCFPSIARTTRSRSPERASRCHRAKKKVIVPRYRNQMAKPQRGREPGGGGTEPRRRWAARPAWPPPRSAPRARRRRRRAPRPPPPPGVRAAARAAARGRRGATPQGRYNCDVATQCDAP